MLKIFRTILLFAISVICIGVMVIFEVNNWPVGCSIGGLLAGIMIPMLCSSISDLTDNENWKTSQRKLERGHFLKRTDKVRISFAYLFRIKIDGKYFLVKNDRGTGKYQPVGGVYKLKGVEAQYLKSHYFVEDDNKIPVDQSSKCDYRLQLQDKYLRRFIRRFDKTTDREVVDDLSREFIEELIGTGILDKTRFSKLKYVYCGRHMTELKFSTHFQCYELLLADVADVELNANQEQMFRILLENENEKYYFASADEINSLGIIAGSDNLQEKIADHSIKILQENAQYLTKAWRRRSNNEFEICL